MLLGSMATLMAAICTRMLRNVEFKGIPLPALLPPVIFNALIVGAELSLFIPEGDPYWFCLLTVGAGELGVIDTSRTGVIYKWQAREAVLARVWTRCLMII